LPGILMLPHSAQRGAEQRMGKMVAGNGLDREAVVLGSENGMAPQLLEITESQVTPEAVRPDLENLPVFRLCQRALSLPLQALAAGEDGSDEGPHQLLVRPMLRDGVGDRGRQPPSARAPP